MPQNFNRIPGWFDFADIYDEAVESAREGARFVEVGVWKGRSLCYLAERIRESGKRIECFGVDPFPLFRQHETCVENLCRAGVYDLVTLFPGTSLEAAAAISGPVDFAFLDGDHSETAVAADLAAWWPKIAPCGVLTGHDYVGLFPGVRKAVDAFFARLSLPVEARGNSWRVRKESDRSKP